MHEARYTAGRGVDRLKTKGVIWAEVDTPAAGRVSVFVTHLQAGSGPDNAAVRAAQVSELLARTRATALAVVLLGDFNFDPDETADRAGVVAEGLGLSVGSPAPRGLAARDLSGEPVALDTLLAEGPTLLVFYRGGWCPYCNHQLHALSQAAPRFEAAGVRLVALSVDKPQEASLTRKSWEIPFPVLSDSALAVHEAFGVVFSIDADTQARYRRIGIDLERSSGRTDGKVAVPSMFLVKDGAVAWAHTDPAYKVRPTPEQVLSALAGAGLP